MLIDGRSTDGYARTQVFEWIPGRPLSIELRGDPLQAVALLAGEPLEPGAFLGVPGILNLGTPFPLFSGFDPSGFLFRTGPQGAFELSLGSYLPFGTEVALQGLVDTAGGPRLTAPERLRSAPARIAYETRFELRGTNVFGVSNVLMHSSLNDSFPEVVFSPDGERIAFAVGSLGVAKRDLFLIDAAGVGANRPVEAIAASATSYLRDVRWNASGERVACLYTDNQSGGSPTVLQIVGRDGIDPITIPIGFVMEYAWSPDGTKIAFRSVVGLSVLFVANADGSNAVPVSTSVPGGAQVGSLWAWSPDSRYLAFMDVTGHPLPIGPADLHVVRADGTGHAFMGADVAQFAWSPDASSIAFRVYPQLVSIAKSLYSIRPDGTGLLRLSGTPPNFSSEVSDFRWSSDSSHVAYLSREGGGGFQLFVVRRDGDPSTRHFLSRYANPGEDVGRFEWSPCGTKIAFSYNNAHRLYVAGSDGVFSRLLSTSVASGFQIKDPFGWNPDPERTTIAFIANADPLVSDQELYAVEADGSHPRRLSGDISLRLEKNTYEWDPSGRWIAFRGSQLHVNEAEGGEPIPVYSTSATFGVSSFTWSPATPPIVRPAPRLHSQAPGMEESP